MENSGTARLRPAEAAKTRRRNRAEKLETGLIVTLAGLVLFKGALALAGIAQGIGEMMMALARL